MHRSPFAWIINHLSYLQTYGLICFLFFLCLLPIGYFWIETHLVNIRLIDEQLGELGEEETLKTLFGQMQEHRLLAMRALLEGGENLDNLHSLEQTIMRTFEEAKTRHRLIGSLSGETVIWQRIDLQSLESKWKDLVARLPRLTPTESDILHTSLIHELLIQFGNLSDKVGISFFKKIANYAMIETVFLRLPHLQENLSRLELISEQDLIAKQVSQDALSLLTRLITADLVYLKQGIELHSSHFSHQPPQAMLTLLRDYEHAATQFIRIIEQGLLENHALSATLPQLQSESMATIGYGFLAWSQGLKDLQAILTDEKALVFRQLWFVLLLTLLLTTLAFSLGLALTRMGTIRLSELTEVTDSFTNGNLSARVSESYQDEIGRQARAFNRMAQKLEEIVKRLYELLDATTALANGDLSARILVRGQDTEFDRVAHSFNKMAETFETIIGRLQQIGMMLTTSASEIASASKEQETIIVQQEGSTREIAVASKEISYTAKTFAQTMNEVSQAADQTSHLAVKGKESLNNMEAVMREMVDASSHIGAKLAILSEKAGNITGVITTITKVADQTNLLSLNASIEAEKAGEYGRSFAVIAREIRRLADQTAIATFDIEKIVNEITTAVASSVMGVDDFTQEIRKGAEQVRNVGGQLAKIIEQVQALTARFESLNQGMQAQSMGAEQINQAIAQLSHTAQQTSEAIHQFHKTIQELNHAANELRILSPFIKPSFEPEVIENLIPNPIETNRAFEPVSKESTRQFNKTLSNLNVAAAKLKNLTIRLHPPKNDASKEN